VRPDERFVREGNDIFSQVDLTVVQAALGASVLVQTLDGEVELDFEPGAQPGEVRVLRGEGMPALRGSGRGSLYVRLDVAVPTALEHPAVQRVLDVAARKGVTLEVTAFPETTHTAGDAARVVGAEIAQIVKSLVFVVATDDGSVGHHGYVTELIPDYEAWADQAFACGPLPMLKALARLAAELGASRVTVIGHSFGGVVGAVLGTGLYGVAVDRVVAVLRERGAHVETGVFGADMQLALVNDGPVTLLLEV